MNILFFYGLPIDPIRGGIERVTHTLSLELKQLRHNCFFLAAKDHGSILPDVGSRQFFLPDSKKISSLQNTVFFESILKEHAIDRVVFQWGDGKRFPYFPVCERLQIPVVVAIHTDPAFYERHEYSNRMVKKLKDCLRRRRQRKIYRYNARHAKATVLLSERFRQGFLKHFPDAEQVAVAKKLVAIANPSTYDPDYSLLALKSKQLLFVGRMEAKVKQPQLLLKIWQGLQERFPEWSLRLVGGGHEEQMIQQRRYEQTGLHL